MSSHFVVMRWNGHDYDDSVDYVDAVFDSLALAVEHCLRVEPLVMYRTDVLPRNEAYSIDEFLGATCLRSFTWEGTEVPHSLY